MTAQNAPAKMDVRPLIENVAELVASDSAARSVTVAMLRLGVTGAVTGRGTLGVTVRVTVRLRFLARWRRCRSALVGSTGRSGVMLVVGSASAIDVILSRWWLGRGHGYKPRSRPLFSGPSRKLVDVGLLPFLLPNSAIQGSTARYERWFRDRFLLGKSDQQIPGGTRKFGRQKVSRPLP